MKLKVVNQIGLFQMKISFILFMRIIISGCTLWYGVRREANIDYMVDHRCIGRALSQVSEVQEVEYNYYKGQLRLTIMGWSEPDQGHQYLYKTSNINGLISLTTNYKQKTEISQNFGTINGKPPQEEIDIIRPIMKKIEASIRDVCGI